MQRLRYKALVLKTRLDCKNKAHHSNQSFTFVADYGQNMELPFSSETQQGHTYYYTPMSVYNPGVVNSAHIHDGDEDPKDYMHYHVYDEGITGKDSNSVASLIMKTLENLHLLENDDSSRELNNCL